MEANTAPKGTFRFQKVMQFAGTMVGTLIGSGFASGQEVMQFFTNYGINGIFGSLITMVLFGLLGAVLMNFGYQFKHSKKMDPFKFFCGKYFGAFFEWFTILFCFLVTVIMISGGGATLNQYFGIPNMIGNIIVALASVVVALLGLRKLVHVLGSIGPVAILFLILIALIALFMNFDNLPNANDMVAAAGDKVVRGVGDSNNWWLVAAVMYVAYNIVAGIPFLSLLGTEAASKKEAIWGGIAGGALLGLCAVFLNLAMLSTYSKIIEVEVPALQFAQLISPIVGLVFVIVLLIMIFNTIVPMLISVANQFAKPQESVTKHRAFIIAIAVIALIVGQLPFSVLVNTIYPFVGYFGVLFMILALAKYIYWAVTGKDGYAEAKAEREKALEVLNSSESK